MIAHPERRPAPTADWEIRLTRPNELTSAETQNWLQQLQRSAWLDSPFFHPQFVRAVAAARADVEIAVVRRHGRAVGFFPFQRDSWNIGWPVAARLSDFHGAVLPDDFDIRGEQLVRACGLRLWHFDHLPAVQQPFRSHHWLTSDSPYLDLRDGWDGYAAERRRAGSNQVGTTLRKSRKLEREVGPLRFEFQADSGDIFESLLIWKAEQLKRMKTLEVLRFPWVNQLLTRLRSIQRPDFGGVLSALYAGDELAAVHFGLRTERVFHIWFPAYNRRFEKYSPGLILLVLLAQHCAAEGVTRIDLGRGPERYKQSFASGAIQLAEGAVTHRPLTRGAFKALYRGRQWVRSTPLRRLVQGPKQLMRRVRYATLPA